MIGISFLTPRQVRRTAIVLLCVSLAFMLLALFFGIEVKGLAALGDDCWHFDPAFGVHETGLCRRLCLAFRRACAVTRKFRTIFCAASCCIVAALLVAQPEPRTNRPAQRRRGGACSSSPACRRCRSSCRSNGSVGLIGACTAAAHVAGRFDRFLTGEGAPSRWTPRARRSCCAATGWRRAGRGHRQADHSGQPYRLIFSSPRKSSASFSAWCSVDLRLHRARRPVARLQGTPTTSPASPLPGLVLQMGPSSR